MRALVLYESMFGNTRDVARAVGEGLAAHGQVEVVEISEAARKIGPEVDLLVIGGPTHAFGLSRPSTRADAAKRIGSSPVSRGIGIREWLDATGGVIPGTAAAAFDTKIDKRFLPGSAAHRATRRLRELRFKIVGEPMSFLVTDVPGPLREGELARARAWGDTLGETVVRSQPAPAVRRRAHAVIVSQAGTRSRQEMWTDPLRHARNQDQPRFGPIPASGPGPEGRSRLHRGSSRPATGGPTRAVDTVPKTGHLCAAPLLLPS